jgi:hypothetical protein
MGRYVSSTVINIPDIDEGVAFLTAALGYVVRSADPTFAVLTDPGRRWSNLSLEHPDERKRGFNRLHLDLYTAGWVRRGWCLGTTRRTTTTRDGRSRRQRILRGPESLPTGVAPQRWWWVSADP